MKYFWNEEDLIEHFTLSAEEHQLLTHKSESAKIGIAVLLKFLQYEGRFPNSKNDIPPAIVRFIAIQINVKPEALARYNWQGRAIEYHRAEIRKQFGFKKWRTEYVALSVDWLQANVVGKQDLHDHLKEALQTHPLSLMLEDGFGAPL